MFKPFTYQKDFDYQTGWDSYALDYSRLLQPGTVYHITKEIMHSIIDKEWVHHSDAPVHVLDVNCGTGNDFPFFLRKGWRITGIDGSAGMLNKASESYHGEIDAGRIGLYHGMTESLSESDFAAGAFDLIFSVTGGFSYIGDELMENVNRQLHRLLKPGGKIIAGHLNTFCLAESLHRLYNLKNPIVRGWGRTRVDIKGEPVTMYFRGPRKLKKMYGKSFTAVRCLPLLAFTPPYQTGFNPSPKMLKRLKSLELKLLKGQLNTYWADQVVVVGESSATS